MMAFAKFGLKRAIPLAVAAASLFVAARGDARELPVRSGVAPLLGSGYDVIPQSYKSACVEGTVGYDGAPVSTVRFDKSLTPDELEQSLGFSTAGVPELASLSNIFRLEFAHRVARTKTSETLIYAYELRGKYATLTNGHLSNVGQSVKGRDASTIRAACGDELVRRIEIGGALYFTIRFDFTTQSDKDAFMVDTDLSRASIANVMGKIDRVKEQYTRSLSVTIEALQIGGNPTMLANIMQGSTGEAGVTIRCSLTNLDACRTALDNARLYTINPTDGFHAQLGAVVYDPTNSVGAAPLRYETIGYKSGGYSDLYDSDGAAVPPELVAARTRLYQLIEAYSPDRARVGALLRDAPLSTLQRARLEAAQKSINKNDALVGSSVEACAASPAQCPQRVQALDAALETYSMDAADHAEWFFTQCVSPATSVEARKTINALSDYVGERDCARAAAEVDALDRIDLRAHGLTDVSALQWLGNLREVNLRDNAIVDAQPVLRSPGITTLDLSYNRVKSADLDALPLTLLRLEGNPITDPGAIHRALDARLPGTALLVTEDEMCHAERALVLSNGGVTRDDFEFYEDTNMAPVYRRRGVRTSGIATWMACAAAAHDLLW